MNDSRISTNKQRLLRLCLLRYIVEIVLKKTKPKHKQIRVKKSVAVPALFLSMFLLSGLPAQGAGREHPVSVPPTKIAMTDVNNTSTIDPSAEEDTAEVVASSTSQSGPEGAVQQTVPTTVASQSALAPNSPPPNPNPPTQTVQVNEQFLGSSLNTSLWEVISYPKGYRNNEEQEYVPSQVKVQDGLLHLIASRDGGGNWKSGEVHSKWNYTYGEFEVRMALSAVGPGVWPAAWLMGTTSHWPNGGEIDIIENINGNNWAQGTIHGGGTSGHWYLQRSFSPVSILQFHTYKIVKTPDAISWWVDGVQRGSWSKADTPPGGTWPFENHRYFGLMNLAIGGNWPGPSNLSTPDTITMYVDYFTVKNAY